MLPLLSYPRLHKSPLSHLGQLPDHAVAFLSDQRLDLRNRQDRVLGGADLDACPGVDEEPEPPLSREPLSDDDAFRSGFVVHLCFLFSREEENWERERERIGREREN